MCMGAIHHARIKRVVYGADDPKAGAVKSIYSIAADRKLNHYLDVEGGLLAAECGSILSDFFRKRRQATREES
jgi:tRNA(adenine34) deaminase